MDVTGFYNHFISQVYITSYANAVHIRGDFNYRIGSLSDAIHGIDYTIPRTVTDDVKNKHGEKFIEFLPGFIFLFGEQLLDQFFVDMQA